ncbi:MAG TPA: family 1 glycosylhydrolase, partial [Micromonosporaceae bacterium]|nr:family 1 glycosylhydrolase [Micromonosporaceae bacterium]
TPPHPTFPGSEGVEFVDQDRPTTVMDWPIDADGLRGLLIRLGRDYPGTPIMITENGAAFSDVVAGDRVADPERVEYLRGHLHAARAAISAGVDLRGYLVWSFLDNFEWAYGYDKRFGLVHVDYSSQRRRLKDSAHWYRRVIADNGLAS